jgi:hypothetical protein
MDSSTLCGSSSTWASMSFDQDFRFIHSGFDSRFGASVVDGRSPYDARGLRVVAPPLEVAVDLLVGRWVLTEAAPSATRAFGQRL